MTFRNFRLLSLLLRIRSGFWFIPFVMIAASMVLVWVTVEFDQSRRLPDSMLFLWIENIGPGGARAIFSTIAGSTITVAGVIFSIAMVVLSMASSQFGPRLIPTFMRVGKIQFGIGLFVGSFVYCLLMLTFVPDQNKAELLPVWGVIVGLFLGIVAFLVLIMLIHEIATFIQAPNVAGRVSRDIRETFDRIFPEEQGEDTVEGRVEQWGESYSSITIRSSESGYIRTINYKGAAECGLNEDCYINLSIKPGQYFISGEKIGTVYNLKTPEIIFFEKLCENVHFGADRDLAQDAEYAVDQMIEIALRALSPGINDPFTALNCIDKLSDALGFLATRQIARPVWRDSQNEVRLVGRADSYRSILDASFSQLRQHSFDNPAVIIRLVEAIGRLASLDLKPEFREALSIQLETIGQKGEMKFEFQRDSNDFTIAFEKAAKLLEVSVTDS